MSLNITVRTDKDIDILDVVRQVACRIHKDLVLIDEESDCIMFFIMHRSVRSTTLWKESNGYAVRSFGIGCEDDYILAADMVKELLAVSGGRAFVDDNDRQEIENAEAYFSSDWIRNQELKELSTIRSLMKEDEKDEGVMLFCPVRNFAIGRRILKDLGLDISDEARSLLPPLWDYVRSTQYDHPFDLCGTTMSMVVPHPTDEEKNVHVTVYKRNAYDFINRADFFALIRNVSEDEDQHELITIPYADLDKILPTGWKRYDNCQYFTSSLTEEEYEAFCDRALAYATNKFFPD